MANDKENSLLIKPVEKKCHTNPVVSCSACRLSDLCLPIALNGDEINQLDEIVQRGRPLEKGDHLYREGAEFTAVYAVRSGSFKTYAISDAGVEQVAGFTLAGEIVGLDGISSQTHCSSAIALERSSVCEIPFDRLEDLSIQLPSLQHHFFRIMGKEITKDQQMLTLLSSNSAEERVAALLVSFSSRNLIRHMSATQFRLTMTRADIGNYLGITVETVSRTITKLQSQNILTVNNKDIEIIDLIGLKKIAKVRGV